MSSRFVRSRMTGDYPPDSPGRVIPSSACANQPVRLGRRAVRHASAVR